MWRRLSWCLPAGSVSFFGLVFFIGVLPAMAQSDWPQGNVAAKFGMQARLIEALLNDRDADVQVLEQEFRDILSHQIGCWSFVAGGDHKPLVTALLARDGSTWKIRIRIQFDPPRPPPPPLQERGVWEERFPPDVRARLIVRESTRGAIKEHLETVVQTYHSFILEELKPRPLAEGLRHIPAEGGTPTALNWSSMEHARGVLALPCDPEGAGRRLSKSKFIVSVEKPSQGKRDLHVQGNTTLRSYPPPPDTNEFLGMEVNYQQLGANALTLGDLSGFGNYQATAILLKEYVYTDASVPTEGISTTEMSPAIAEPWEEEP